MDSDPTAHTRDVDGRIHDGCGAIIMLEGLDATGKSTFAVDLYKTLKAPVAILHAGPPVVTTAIREYVWPLGIAANGYVVICDRWHLGEMVWPSIFDREPLINNAAELNHIEENIKYLRTPILALMMQRAMKDIVVDLQERQEPVGHLHEANELYQHAVEYSHLHWQNTTLPRAGEIVRRWLHANS